MPIGFGKSRGLGRVAVQLEEMTVSYPGRFDPVEDGMDFQHHLYGVETFKFEGKEEYGFVEESPLVLDNPSPELSESGEYGRVAVTFRGDAVGAVLRETVPWWRDYVRDPMAQQEG